MTSGFPDRETLDALLGATLERVLTPGGALARLASDARGLQLELAEALGVDSETYHRVDELADRLGERARESLRAGLLIGAAWAMHGSRDPLGPDVRGNGSAGLLDRLVGVFERYRLSEQAERAVADESLPPSSRAAESPSRGPSA